MSDNAKIVIVYILVLIFIFGTVYLVYQETNGQQLQLKTKEYQRGFNEGMNCLALTNLEKMLNNDSRSFEELMKVCRERHKIEENN